MSRGLGWVQSACLYVVKRREGQRLAYHVQHRCRRLSGQADGDRIVSDAQHVAVKRALEGLQRKGMVIGFRDTHHRAEGRPNIELCHVWMTETGLAGWLAELRADFLISHNRTFVAEVTADLDAIAMRARAIGMRV